MTSVKARKRNPRLGAPGRRDFGHVASSAHRGNNIPQLGGMFETPPASMRSRSRSVRYALLGTRMQPTSKPMPGT